MPIPLPIICATHYRSSPNFPPTSVCRYSAVASICCLLSANSFWLICLRMVVRNCSLLAESCFWIIIFVGGNWVRLDSIGFVMGNLQPSNTPYRLQSMEKHKIEIEEFLRSKVNPLLEPMTVDIIKARPENIPDFCVKWLEDRLRSGSPTGKKQRPLETHIDISDEQDDMVEDEAFKARKSKNTKRNRSAVSAEVYGEFNRKEEFKPPVYPKSEEAITRILILLNKSILFKGLDDKDTKIVIDAMQDRLCKPGETIIEEGEGGDVLFMVDEGEFECHKKIDGVTTYLKTYKIGEAFGELALLYNAPRAATIKAKTSGKLYALDRNTFNNIVKESTVKRKKLYEDTLKKVELLDSIDPYERTQICDVLKEAKYSPGEYVIRQGDSGDKFYIVVQGRLVAERKDANTGQNKVVYQYKQGDYFGEIALVRNIPRQASVKVLTYATIVSIDRSAFKRLLGPIEEILKRNEDRYKKFWNFTEAKN